MHLPRILRFVAAAAIVVAAVTTATARQASAMQGGFGTVLIPDNAPKGYNHILCYAVAPVNQFPPVNVSLFDQFYPNGFPATLNQVGNACTPAKKKLLGRKPIKGFIPNGHFVCYSFSPPAPVNKTTRYVNQLETNSMTWNYPYLLCVPTYKSTGAGSTGRLTEAGAAPRGFNHLLVYDQSKGGVTFTNPLPATTVTLYDQFYPNGFTVMLGNPVLLLTPTKKVYKQGHKVVPNGHWATYYFTPPPTVQDPRNYVNQLEMNSLTAFFPNYLLVPTYKYPPSGTSPELRPHRRAGTVPMGRPPS